jgi:hypothetical protein
MEQDMNPKRIADHGSGRKTDTEERGFTRGPNVQPGRPPGSPPPEPGNLQKPRQSGTGGSPPNGEEDGRPRDTGRKGA